MFYNSSSTSNHHNYQRMHKEEYIQVQVAQKHMFALMAGANDITFLRWTDDVACWRNNRDM